MNYDRMKYSTGAFSYLLLLQDKGEGHPRVENKRKTQYFIAPDESALKLRKKKTRTNKTKEKPTAKMKEDNNEKWTF